MCKHIQNEVQTLFMLNLGYAYIQEEIGRDIVQSALGDSFYAPVFLSSRFLRLLSALFSLSSYHVLQ